MDINWNDTGRLACVALVADEIFNIYKTQNSSTIPTIGPEEFKMIGGKPNPSRAKYSLYRQLVWAYRFLKCWTIRNRFPSAGHVSRVNSLFEFRSKSFMDDTTDSHMKSSHASKVTRLICLFEILRNHVTRKSTNADIYNFLHTHVLSEEQFQFCGGIPKYSSIANRSFIRQFEYMLYDISLYFEAGKFPQFQVLQKVTKSLLIPEYNIKAHIEDDNEEVDDLDGAKLWTDSSAVHTFEEQNYANDDDNDDDNDDIFDES